MEHSTRLAHISEDGTRTQTVYDHLAGTAAGQATALRPIGTPQKTQPPCCVFCCPRARHMARRAC